MPTQCNAEQLEFANVERRRVVAAFDGGRISSQAGVLLLQRADERLGLLDRLAQCFRDARDPEAVEHSVRTLLGQRIFGMALAYEDVNDHEQLRSDPLFGAALGKLESQRSDCEALAGKSTLNRLELYPKAGVTRYQKIRPDTLAIERLLVDLFIEAHAEAPEQIVLDLDATDDPLHGEQEGRFFHGYYGGYCYLPLYIFCGRHLLCAKLRTADIDGSAGAVEELERLVAQIRERWPTTRIIVRGDSHFAREGLMSFCEHTQVDYVFGLAKNARLIREIDDELYRAALRSQQTGQSARVFKDFTYATLDSWSRERRVIGKAEHTPKGTNPRFIVTSLDAETYPAQALYEDLYCARGEMENRIKEAQLDLFADRLSTHTFRGNQLRLWLSSFAYVLMEAIRRLGLCTTQLANATASTIRLKLLKIGALITLSVRRVKVAMSSACAYQTEFIAAFHGLRAAVR
jgi:hypothetical protein